MAGFSASRCLYGTTAIMSFVVAAPAVAQTRNFDVPSQALGVSIRTIARQGDIQIIAPHRLIRDKLGRAVRGSMNIEEALGRLLADTGLTVRKTSPRSYVVMPSAPGLNAAGEEVSVRPRSDADGDAANSAGAEIVVQGLRKSIETTQSIRRDSDQIIDSVVAEDIGKLPDVTAAESLARITGVQVTREQGEATGVRVRGLPNVTSTYNGRDIFTLDGRIVNFQEFPSAGVAGIDVYKFGSADLLEGGIAGSINVRGRRPFDFKGSRFAGSVNGVNWYQSQHTGINASALLSNRWTTGIGEIGILVSASYTDADYLDANRVDALQIQTRTLAGFANPIRYPNFVNINYASGNRWRPAGTVVLQWRPTPNLDFYFDGLYQGFRSKTDNSNLQVSFNNNPALTNVVLQPGSNLVQSMSATGGAAPSGSHQLGQVKTNGYQGALGFNWRSGRLKLSGDFAYTDSSFTNSLISLNYVTTTSPARDVNFDVPEGPGGPTVSLRNYDVFNPANFRMSGFNDRLTTASGKDYQAKLDAKYALPGSPIDLLQAGVRFASRRAERYEVTRSATAPARQFFNVLDLDYYPGHIGFRNDDILLLRRFITPTPQSLIDKQDYLRSIVGLPAGFPVLETPVYRAREDAYTGYVQAHYKLNIGLPIDGLIGLRAVRTDNTISGTARGTLVVNGAPTAVATPISQKRSYTDYLPNFSARLRITDQFQARFAATATRSRPAFVDMNPSLTIDAQPAICVPDPANPGNGPTNPACFRTANGGNPNLKPTRSKNYDVAFEYFFSRTGSATLGLFRRDVKGFVSDFVTDVNDPQFGRLNVTRPDNGGSGRIQGLEVGFTSFLKVAGLPRWLQNFGVQANYTYLDHGSQLPAALAATLPGQQPLAGVSSHLANLVGLYESRFVSARLAYNYRSKFVVNYQQIADPATGVLSPAIPLWEKGRGTLDLSTSVSPNEHFTLAFNASNLLRATARNARAFNTAGDSFPNQIRYLETVYSVGIRFRF